MMSSTVLPQIVILWFEAFQHGFFYALSFRQQSAICTCHCIAVLMWKTDSWSQCTYMCFTTKRGKPKIHTSPLLSKTFSLVQKCISTSRCLVAIYGLFPSSTHTVVFTVYVVTTSVCVNVSKLKGKTLFLFWSWHSTSTSSVIKFWWGGWLSSVAGSQLVPGLTDCNYPHSLKRESRLAREATPKAAAQECKGCLFLYISDTAK